MTRLDDIAEPWSSGYDPRDPHCGNRVVVEAIHAAYRLGHEDGRHARIPQGDQTFIDALRENQDAQEP